MLSEFKFLEELRNKRDEEKESKENKIDILKLAQAGPQYEFLNSKADIAFYGGGAGGGKLLPLDTPLPTPTGWILMRDICVGVKLFDEKGNVCFVEEVFPIEENPILYRFEFDDGTTIDSCKDHLWKTFTAKDLLRMTKSNEDWKKKRRENRSSRAQSNNSKSELFMQKLLHRNRTIIKTKKDNLGTVKSTKEIVESLFDGKRSNHAISICHAINLPKRELPLDPYLLGLWLGDGTTITGTITTADMELCKDWIKIPSSKYTYRVPGLTKILRGMNLIGNKHVPESYLRSNRQQRMALLQGLMDSDGTVTRKSGSVSFCNTNEKLVDAVIELACSLGHKPGKKCEGKAKLKGIIVSKKWSVKWTPSEIVFRIERKKILQKISKRRVTNFRYIKKAYLIESRPGRCIKVSSESKLFLCGERMIPTHNTFSLLLLHLNNSHNNKFRSVIFRRNSTQVRNPGGLWHESMGLYKSYNAHPREAFLEWRFPSGSTIKFAHLEHEKSVYDWQGSQIPFIAFDEATHFTEHQFTYMLSRNRSVSGVKPIMRATCNPDVTSWVREWVDWYIDEHGYAIQERSGLLRYFIRKNGVMHWSDSEQELKNKFGQDENPKSFTFIAAKVTDNKILMEKDPSYISNLKALSKVERERLLDANWNTKVVAGSYFQQQWFEILDAIPGGFTHSIRYWDRASTKPNEENKDPDWTRGIKLLKYPNGIFVVADLRSLRDTPLQVEQLIKNTASFDSTHTVIYGEEDPGAAGKADIGNFTRMLSGYQVKVTRPTKDKETRAKPVSAQCEFGNIKILRAPWNKEFFEELENFPYGAHDDIVDAFSGAFNVMCGNRSILNIL